MGHDFLAFYTAGVFVDSGRANDLYDLKKIQEFQHPLAAREGLEIGNDFGPFWNPPFFAWMFVPLAKLSYFRAWDAWFVFNIACAAGAMVMLARMVAKSRGPSARPLRESWRDWALVPLLICVSLPFVQALGHGQNSCLSLLLLTATAVLWRGGRARAFAAGACAGLLFYKP
jgi:hypothetical protein